jgi:hypothetical protein
MGSTRLPAGSPDGVTADKAGSKGLRSGTRCLGKSPPWPNDSPTLVSRLLIKKLDLYESLCWSKVSQFQEYEGTWTVPNGVDSSPCRAALESCYLGTFEPVGNRLKTMTRIYVYRWNFRSHFCCFYCGDSGCVDLEDVSSKSDDNKDRAGDWDGAVVSSWSHQSVKALVGE